MIPAVPASPSIPFPDNKWDEVSRNLFVGGHMTVTGAPCFPEDHFDLIVSLVNEGPLFEPTNGAPVIYYLFEDAALEPERVRHLNMLADMINEARLDGNRVLVRCHGGINRSAFVAALAMVRHCDTPYQAVMAIRRARTPYALCNTSFTDHLDMLW